MRWEFTICPTHQIDSVYKLIKHTWVENNGNIIHIASGNWQPRLGGEGNKKKLYLVITSIINVFITSIIRNLYLPLAVWGGRVSRTWVCSLLPSCCPADTSWDLPNSTNNVLRFKKVNKK